MITGITSIRSSPHHAAANSRRDSQWVDHLREEYRFRREHEDARRNLGLARPINQFASIPHEPIRFEPLDRERREELAGQSAQLHQYREQRKAREIETARLRPLTAA